MRNGMKFALAALMGALAFSSHSQANETQSGVHGPAQRSPIQTFDSGQTRCTDRPAPGTFQYTLMTVVESNALPNVVIRFYALTDVQGDLIGLMTHRTDHPVAKVYGLCEIRNGLVKVHERGESGRLVSKLQGADMDGHSGGTIQISYLYNGASMTYRSNQFDVVREGGRWRLYWIWDPRNDPHSRELPFDYLFMPERRIWPIGRVGIASLQPELLTDQERQEYARFTPPLPQE